MADGPLPGRPLPSSFDGNEDFYNESGAKKIVRKIKEEPLIPIGCALTVAAFVNAYRAMRRGDHHGVQRMFRARVAAQGFTVVAMVAGGMYYAEDREKRKELWKLQQQKSAEEKREKWIKELEARDEEEKALRETLDKRRKRAAERATSAETGTEGVAAQARAALREAKAAKGGQAVDGDASDNASETPDGEKRVSGGVLSSLGGWFGGSGKPQGVVAKGPDGPEKRDSTEGQK
ncbi:hypoxia induced protein conserved region-domain-containing protein [Staphylotrichum tortipilum]|uniref:Hypoxia induced protein conserved region-domain-containing protein n=1 Tax=Staphylotrichum tortipilum TaxID=2831512 RepID=A0AAN6RVS4_9PEZI|nr:hypoxia induced protein conserved region-domain-containing protein [Staphylotrichum longicolle]